VSGTAKSGGTGKGGCALGAAVVGGLAAFVLVTGFLGEAWGDDAWRWADRSCPGGAYAFAVAVGAAWPGSIALAALLLIRFWQRVACRIAVLTAAAAVFALCWALAGDAMSTAHHAKGSHRLTSPASWAYTHLPWLWAVGAGTSVVVTAIVLALALHGGDARRTRRSERHWQKVESALLASDAARTSRTSRAAREQRHR
jgi:hypothetical protein